MDYERSRSPTMRSKTNNPNVCDGSGKVYVCFLPSQVQEPQLKETFQECGQIKSIYIKRKDDGFTFAYIEYEDPANAQKAIEKLNRRKIGDKSIMVKPGNKNPASNVNGGQRPTFKDNGSERNFDRNRNNDRSADRNGGGFRHQRNGGGDGERKPMKCFKCQGEGHMSRNCTQSQSDNVGQRRPMKCYKCQGQGHIARNCTQADGGDGNRGGQRGGQRGGDRGGQRGGQRGGDRGGDRGERKPMKCFKCQGEGHMSRNCPQAEGGNNDRPQRENNDRRPNYDRPPRDHAPKVQKPAEDIDY